MSGKVERAPSMYPNRSGRYLETRQYYETCCKTIKLTEWADFEIDNRPGNCQDRATYHAENKADFLWEILEYLGKMRFGDPGGLGGHFYCKYYICKE